MSWSARPVALVAVWLLVLSASCHERRSPTEGRPAVVGSYKAVLRGDDGRDLRFRVLLWAEMPDRVHAEAVSPTGGTEVIVDGGGGTLSVAVVRDRTAYVGPATPDALRRVLGVPVSLAGLVRAILEGQGLEGEGIVMTREPESAPGLPRSFEIREARRAFRIDGRRLLRDARLAPSAGTGSPPSGIETRPLDSLPSGGALERVAPVSEDAGA